MAEQTAPLRMSRSEPGGRALPMSYGDLCLFSCSFGREGVGYLCEEEGVVKGLAVDMKVSSRELVFAVCTPRHSHVPQRMRSCHAECGVGSYRGTSLIRNTHPHRCAQRQTPARSSCSTTSSAATASSAMTSARFLARYLTGRGGYP